MVAGLLENSCSKIHLGLLTILGFSFWFLVGFPFANYNESYVWIALLNKLGFWDTFTHRFEVVVSFRPLFQASGWLAYRLLGNSMNPVQIINYVWAMTSWLILFGAIKEKRVFSLLSLVVGGVFFSGYIYLFTLHGIGYSSLLFMTAILFYKESNYFSKASIIQLFLLTFICSQFHSFAFLLFLAFTAGMMLEKRNEIARWQILAVLIFALAMIMTGYIEMRIFYEKVPSLTNLDFLNVLSTYKTVEVNRLASLVSLSLVIITIMSMRLSALIKMLVTATATLLSIFFMNVGLPIIMLWIFTCLLKAIILKKWSIASLIGMAFLIPLFGYRGHPTYAIMVLMACAAIVPMGWPAFEAKLGFFNAKIASSLTAIVLVIALTLRMGVDLPIISKLANPLLAEKEKTFQLESVIKWVMQSQYSDYELRFNKSKYSLTSVEHKIDRTNRPPTLQQFLDYYMDWLRPAHQKDIENSRSLLVCFGSEKIEGAGILYVVKGKYAGDAIVYLQSE